MKSWFYHGFTKRHQLSCTRVAEASRKLPSDWRNKVRHIIERVANSQQWRRIGENTVSPILDKYLVNTDHLLFYRDMAGMYWQTKQGVGGRNKRNFRGQIGTGGGEKTDLPCN